MKQYLRFAPIPVLIWMNYPQVIKEDMPQVMGELKSACVRILNVELCEYFFVLFGGRWVGAWESAPFINLRRCILSEQTSLMEANVARKNKQPCLAIAGLHDLEGTGKSEMFSALTFCRNPQWVHRRGETNILHKDVRIDRTLLEMIITLSFDRVTRGDESRWEIIDFTC